MLHGPRTIYSLPSKSAHRVPLIIERLIAFTPRVGKRSTAHNPYQTTSKIESVVTIKATNGTPVRI